MSGRPCHTKDVNANGTCGLVTLLGAHPHLRQALASLEMQVFVL